MPPHLANSADDTLATDSEHLALDALSLRAVHSLWVCNLDGAHLGGNMYWAAGIKKINDMPAGGVADGWPWPAALYYSTEMTG
jgi:hypothetical protein